MPCSTAIAVKRKPSPVSYCYENIKAMRADCCMIMLVLCPQSLYIEGGEVELQNIQSPTPPPPTFATVSLVSLIQCLRLEARGCN